MSALTDTAGLPAGPANRVTVGRSRIFVSALASPLSDMLQTESVFVQHEFVLKCGRIPCSRTVCHVTGPDPNAEWWTTTDVATYLGVAVATVSAYRSRGQMPEPDQTLGRTRLWRPHRIIAWRPRQNDQHD